MRRLSPLLWFAVLLLLVVAVSTLGPSERSLGSHVRLVYLHGAWVWTALAGFAAAALLGIVGLALRRPTPQRWSVALGQAALIFWLTYLPMSLWVMQANWNGLFLQEPRWRLGLDLAVVDVLVQGAILVLGSLAWASWLNFGVFGALAWALTHTPEVMHPSSPIFGSGSPSIELFFLALVTLCLVSGWQLARWLLRRAALP